MAAATGEPTSDATRRALSIVRVVLGALTRSARVVERHTGVTNAQLFLLQQLAGPDPLTIGALANRARTSHSTVSIVVGRLARRGLVTKRRSRADARAAEVALTAKGRRILRNAPVSPTASLIRAIESLSAREVQSLERGLGGLARALGVEATEPALLFEDSGSLLPEATGGEPPRARRHTPPPRRPSRQ